MPNESPEIQERGHRHAVPLSYVGGWTYDRGALTCATTGWPNVPDWRTPPHSHMGQIGAEAAANIPTLVLEPGACLVGTGPGARSTHVHVHLSKSGLNL